MKTFLAIIGVLALIVIGLIGVFIVVGFQKAGPILKEGHAYADEAIPAIISEWDGAALKSRAAPELLDILSDDEVEHIMSFGTTNLGALLTYSGASCTLTQYLMTTNQGEVATLQCTSTATFELADASITLNIVRRLGEWRILGFFVTPGAPRNTPTTVSYVEDRAMDLLDGHMVLDRRSIGWSAKTPLKAGVEIRGKSKIDNFR